MATTRSRNLSDLHARLPLAMATDALRLARRLRRARGGPLPPGEMAQSRPRSRARSKSAPPAWPRSRRSGIRPTCPVAQRAAEIERAIRAHPVVIVCGETGSGKTTQLPKICLSAGRGVRGLIGHTQPRRIAARAVATRIAQELGQPRGRGGRLQGALHRPDPARRVRQAHDRRHPARRDAGRPRPRRLRHHHRRRGARAQPQHRLPAGLPEAAAARGGRTSR